MIRGHQRGFTLVEMMVVVAIVAILAGLMIGLTSKPYGANPRNVSDQLVQTLQLAKMRAVSTRKFHRVEVTGSAAVSPAVPNSIILWQWTETGMTRPVDGICAAGVNCWQVVQQLTLPKGVSFVDGSLTVAITAGSVTVTPDTATDFLVDIKPDGSSTGGTIFLADSQNKHPWRVLVYRATGSSYAREGW